MRLRAFRVPPMDNGVYVLADAAGDALVIDPSFGERAVLEAVRADGLRVLEVLHTHGHPDHTYAAAAVRAATGAPVSIHRLDAYRLPLNQTAFPELGHPPLEADTTFDEGDERRLADLRLAILHTPGHTEGSVCFHLPEEAVLFSGDTLFNGTLGRFDQPGGDANAIVASLRRLVALPQETRVYPGHGPPTTIEAERAWIESLTVEALTTR